MINTLSRAYHPKTGKRNHQIRITMSHAFWPLFLTSIFCVVRENQWKMITTQMQIRIFYNRRILHGGSGGSFSKNVASRLQCGKIWITILAINCCINFSHEKRNFSFFQKNIFSFYKKRIFFIKIQWFLCVFWLYGCLELHSKQSQRHKTQRVLFCTVIFTM